MRLHRQLPAAVPHPAFVGLSGLFSEEDSDGPAAVEEDRVSVASLRSAPQANRDGVANGRPLLINYYNSLLELYSCPVCLDYMCVEFRQCRNSHPLCMHCAARLGRCPCCRVDGPFWRNRLLETVADDILFPCRHAARGCGAYLAQNAYYEHADECEYQPPALLASERGRIDRAAQEVPWVLTGAD